MPVEPFIRDFDKPSVEGPLGGALLVATYKKYSTAQAPMQHPV
jgi:hypothetical protein